MPPTSQTMANKSQPLTLEVHTDLNEVRESWLEFERGAKGGPHDTWEWADIWSRTVGRFAAPLIAIGRNASGDIVFLLPLTIRKHLGCNVLEWLGADQGNYASGLFHPAAWSDRSLPRGKELLALVLDALPRVDAVHLDKQPCEIEKGFNPLAGLPGVVAASAGHAFQINTDRKTPARNQISSRFRRTLRRGQRRLADEGRLEFKVMERAPDQLDAIDNMIREKRAWFAEMGISDFFARRNMREFFQALVQLPGNRAGLTARIYELRVGGKAVATNLGVIHQNIFYGLIASTTRNPLRRFGPGSILFLRIVEHLASEGVEKVDCGAGEDENKRRWCTEERVRRHAIVPVTAKGHVYAAILKAALLAKLQIKQSPKLWSLTKRLRRWRPVPGASRALAPAGSPAGRLQA